VSQDRASPWSALQHLYADPFRIDSAQVAHLSAREIEERQRSALARLVIVNFTAFEGVSLILAMIGHTAAAILAIQAGSLAFSLLCLGILAARRPTLASAVYIYGVFIPLVLVGLDTPGGLDIRSVLVFMLLALFILLSGLLLPRWAIWLTAALGIGVLAISLLFSPLSPQLRLMGAPDPRLFIGGFLALVFISVALITWLLARSAAGGIRSALQAYQQEQDLAVLKDQFIIYVNHELRTPIMGLYGNVELLLKLGDRANADQRAGLLQRALRSGDATLKLLSSVLDADVLKPGSIQITPEAFVLIDLVRDTVAGFDPREIGEPGLEGIPYAARDVTCTIPADLKVYADPARLRQVIVNLLTNALKYSPAGSPIAIAAQRLAPRGGDVQGMVQVSVRDFGLGIPPKEAQKLFQRFVRLERDIAGPVRGTGVGLYLCRELIGAMGGRIWVESRGIPGEGSTFHFTLPTAPASATDTTPGKVAAGQPAKLFVADDIAGQRIALADYAGRKVLLAFLRSASCPLCNARIWYLTQNYARFHEQGLDVIAVLESPREATLRYTRRLHVPFPLIPDPQLELFRLYGVGRSWLGMRGSIRLGLRLRSWRNGHRRFVSEGALNQLPADILITPDLVVYRAHYGQDVGDHLSLREVEQFAALSDEQPVESRS
jgi:signal transduction histidine kinase/peroxiredoxin